MDIEDLRPITGDDGSVFPYLDLVSEGLFIYDVEDERYIFTNSALNKITGPDTARSRGFIVPIVHEKERDKARLLLEDCRKSCDGKLRELEVRLMSREGTARLTRIKCLPIMKKDGAMLIAGSMEDIHQLYKAKRDAQLYLDLMTHDLTNKHQVILMNLEILRNLMDPDENVSKRFGSAIRHLGQAMDTIRSVKVLADVGLGPFEGEGLDLAEEIEQGLDIARSFDPIFNLDLKLDLHIERISVMADRRLKFVIYHLLVNAVIHNNSDRPVLHISSEEDGDQVKITFQDNGPGLPEWIENDIGGLQFLDVEKAEGRGLGLPLVSSLVRFYGGRMEVENAISKEGVSGSKIMLYLNKATLET